MRTMCRSGYLASVFELRPLFPRHDSRLRSCRSSSLRLNLSAAPAKEGNLLSSARLASSAAWFVIIGFLECFPYDAGAHWRVLDKVDSLTFTTRFCVSASPGGRFVHSSRAHWNGTILSTYAALAARSTSSPTILLLGSSDKRLASSALGCWLYSSRIRSAASRELQWLITITCPGSPTSAIVS